MQYSTMLTPEAFALLETIAGPESAGNYNVKYGGGLFDSYADHPRDAVVIQSGPNKGKTSSAAGKYQFLGSTWDDVSEITGVQDFSPKSQDINAWVLAQQEYKRDTGRSLQADLASGNISQVAPSLKDQWTSMPGGIEQGISGDAFSNAYWGNMGLNLNVNPALGALTDATRGVAPKKGILPDPIRPQAMLPSIAAPKVGGTGAMNDIGIMPKMFELGQGNEWWKTANKNAGRSILPAILPPAKGPVPINPPKGGGLFGGLFGNIANSVQGAVRGVQSNINPVGMMLNSLPLRTAVIDPQIKKFFSNGSDITPRQVSQANWAVGNSGDNSTGNQAEAAAVRASAQAWRDNHK